MKSLRLKYEIVNKLIRLTEQVGHGSVWAYERLTGIRADLKARYYSLRSQQKFFEQKEN